MKKVLAIGGAGFVGSYICRELLGAGFQVTVVDNFSKYGYVMHDFYSNKNCKVIKKDARKMKPAEYKGYDFVICLAALIGGIKYFNKIPYQIARDNTSILTSSIDNTLAGCPKATFVYFSSSMVFERMQRPVTEEDALNQPVPLTNYGMQKLFGEFITRGAAHEYGLQFLIVRPFNAVGSGELPTAKKDGSIDFGMAHVIPDFIYKAIIRQSPFEIFGQGEQVRTFTHARDIAEMLKLLLQKNIKNDDFNICGNVTHKMSDMAKTIWAKVNPGVPFPGFKHLGAPSADVQFRIGLADKAKKLLGWEPKYDLEYIINDTAGYIKKHYPVKK